MSPKIGHYEITDLESGTEVLDGNFLDDNRSFVKHGARIVASGEWS